jgi:hypothetical protein
MHRDHAQGDSPRLRRTCDPICLPPEPRIALRQIDRRIGIDLDRLGFISLAIGLALDDLFGEVDQHPFCPIVP